MNIPLRLIVGLGNPGTQYQDTRHNAGVWFVAALARKEGASFGSESKFFGQLTRFAYHGADLRLLLPDTYMNESGKSVSAVCQFFKISANEILVVHDEIDLPVGTVRLKQGGGLAGHNGLKSVAASMGNDQSFNRLRIGVGRPEQGKGVNHVLGKVGQEERRQIDACIEEALTVLPLLVKGEWQKAMMQLH